MGIIFVFVFAAWWVFESGAAFKAMEILEKDKLDKKAK